MSQIKRLHAGARYSEGSIHAGTVYLAGQVAVVTGATDAQVFPPFVVYLDSPLLPTIVQVALAAQAIALGTNWGVTVTVPTADDEA